MQVNKRLNKLLSFSVEEMWESFKVVHLIQACKVLVGLEAGVPSPKGGLQRKRVTATSDRLIQTKTLQLPMLLDPLVPIISGNDPNNNEDSR